MVRSGDDVGERGEKKTSNRYFSLTSDMVGNFSLLHLLQILMSIKLVE